MDKRNGFTIIEVSLVLAIAGLVFVMAFVALPGLWRSERDSERKESVATLVRELKNFQTNNNRGALPAKVGASGLTVTWNEVASIDNPSGWGGFYKDFLGEKFMDPGGEHYTLMIMNCDAALDTECKELQTADLGNATFPNGYKIYVMIGASCDGETAKAIANERKVAVLYRLEGGGVYCMDS
ncbi:MAG: type II secretion system protein [Candidatus Saccharibacteria bacterium]|nr:type II secretion system protein [Candidatus Saccharibacteria bacterium]